MNLLRKFSFTILLIALVLMGFSDAVLAQNPPPRPVPSQDNTTKNKSDDDDDDDGIILGDIYGQVIDKSTGKPGAGLTVVINNIPIRTDASGKFSLTGIADGAYNIDLDLPSEFVSAQASQEVNIVNRSKVNIELGYYSVYSEDTSAEGVEEHALEDTKPEVLPETGGILASISQHLSLEANLLLIIGGALCLISLACRRNL